MTARRIKTQRDGYVQLARAVLSQPIADAKSGARGCGKKNALRFLNDGGAWQELREFYLAVVYQN